MMEGIFDRYWQEVAHIAGGKASKGHAIALSQRPPPSFDGVSVVGRLYQALNCERWKSQVGTNWVWRDAGSQYETTSPEVSLEREIVAAAQAGEWTYQLSTASGIDGGRRAIDLTRRLAPDHYAFVELKVNSDNPLFAVFELLSYALAYLHARRNQWQGQGRYDVLSAQSIDLVVLGPDTWYTYKQRGRHQHQFPFEYNWLTEGLSEGLAALPGAIPAMRVYFEAFVNEGDAAHTAARIRP